MIQIDTAILGHAHLDHRRQTLPPGDLVGVVLVGTDENDRLMVTDIALELIRLPLPEKTPKQPL